jgi:CheY-like chemotaxis protein
VDRVFDSFTQAGSDIARKFGGTGLGLTISKQLATLMNGDIVVTSELGEGTTFSVLLPLEEAAVQEVTKKPEVINAAIIKKLEHVNILLVEDNEFNRMVAEDTIKEAIPTAKITMAFNGQEAVEKVSTNDYDIVLMDIQMPVMDGVEATKAIRNLPPSKNGVNIIAMTANVLQEDIQRYLEAGMNAHIAKPFQKEELLAKMSNMVENSARTVKTEQIADVEKSLSELPETITDMEFLQKFTGNNSEKMNKYISMFLENAPKLLETVDRSLAEKNYPAVKIAAHSLKPQLSYMGVKEEVSNIFLIEQTAGETAHIERLQLLVTNLHKVCAKAFEELKASKVMKLS